MQDLTVIGVENGALLASGHDGSRYRIPIDEMLQSRLRQTLPDPVATAGRKPAPREIQAQIRAGMSAEDVAAVTGVSLEYIQKYEGPVLAEREFVIESALNVGVHTAIESDALNQGSTFGSVIRGRLHDLGATGERWASWKEADGGWVVKLQFTAEQIDHDARWRYEPRKAALAPLNSEANTLSQQGEMPGALIPRLRAVGGDERALDSSRFDSGAFDLHHSRTGELTGRDTAPHLESVPFARAASSSAEVSAAAINRAPADEVASSQTADLLEALRRRRGERESAAAWEDDDARATHPSAGGVRLIDVPLADFGDLEQSTAEQPVTSPFAPRASSGGQAHPSQASTGQVHTSQANTGHHDSSGSPKSSARKGRAAMPSWDEIVFGARSDDDLS